MRPERRVSACGGRGSFRLPVPFLLRRFCLAAGAALGLLTFSVTSLRLPGLPLPALADGGASPASPIPDDVRAAIDEALRAKAGKLANEKDANGQQLKRGTYSKDFHRIDDDTYIVAFHRDIASSDKLLT